MATDKQSPEASEKQDSPEENGVIGRLLRPLIELLAKAREWTLGSRLRTVAVGSGLLLLMVATLSTWLYLASLAVAAEPPTLAEAMEAYDNREFEASRYMAARIMNKSELLETEESGLLFLLGAIKAAEAETQWSRQQGQSQYLIAAKYLQEASNLGFPKDREVEGYRLLGKSLIESGDIEEGLKSLEKSLLLSPSGSAKMHLTLAKAYHQADPPQPRTAMQHIDTALASPDLAAELRLHALLERITLLTALGQFDEARETLKKVVVGDGNQSAVTLATGRIDLAEAHLQRPLEASASDIPSHLRDQVTGIIQSLQTIPASDDSGEEAMYLVGDAYSLIEETKSATQQYEKIRKQFSSSPIGIAASIAEGDIYRTKKHDYQQALAAYRRGLVALEQPQIYRNPLLPLSELRQRVRAAHTDFTNVGEYEAAAHLVELLAPLFGRTKQLELRATTLSNWANHLITESQTGQGNFLELRSEGRRRYREAGATFEALAKRQITTPQYPDAVWQSAESYFGGQSYTSAIRLLDEYLRNEPVKRNAMALLRLGQAHLARGEVDLGIGALEECIESHPHDAALYRARLDCAKAYRDRDDFKKAEQLLLANLNGSGQSPRSPEWQDSLFSLGRLLHDTGRYDDAIDRLDEAIHRYPQSKQTRLAMYLIGESHRHAAEAPLLELEGAKTVNERESSTKLAKQHLTEALHYYGKVWAAITSNEEAHPLDRALLRNCYMLRGAVLFDLGRVEQSPLRFKEAIDAYSNVSTLYQHEPFVLETFVQIANCQRRLHQPMKARMNIDRALQLLDQMPEDADFLATTNFNRGEWKSLLTRMLEW